MAPLKSAMTLKCRCQSPYLQRGTRGMGSIRRMRTVIQGAARSGSVMTGSGTALGGCHGTLLFNGQRGCYSEGEGSFPGTHSQHTAELWRNSAGVCAHSPHPEPQPLVVFLGRQGCPHNESAVLTTSMGCGPCSQLSCLSWSPPVLQLWAQQ